VIRTIDIRFLLSALSILFLGQINDMYSTPARGKSVTSEHLLPDIKPWIKGAKPDIYEKKQLFQYINGAADVFFEYGFLRVISQKYTEGERTLLLDIYQMESAEAAFGIFSFRRDPSSKTLDIGGGCSLSDYNLLFWQGAYFIQIMAYSSDEVMKNILMRFARATSQQIGESSPVPALIKNLPAPGKLPGSEGLVGGPIGFKDKLYLGDDDLSLFRDGSSYGVFASYLFEQENGQLFLFDMVTESQAQKGKQRVIDALKKKFATENTGEEIFVDSRGRYYSTAASDRFLYIFFKASSQNVIRRLLAGTK
jgi:hypothetical protein